MLLLDGDMLVRTNIDDLFAHSVPAAVMRGEVDTSLLKPRPSPTNFQTATSHRKDKDQKSSCKEVSTAAWCCSSLIGEPTKT